jgi:hypothetical protein
MVLLLIALAVFTPFAAFTFSGATSSSSVPTAPPRPAPLVSSRAVLSVTVMKPLVVVGKGFRRQERVQVTAVGIVRRTRASNSGTFTVRFPNRTNGCAVGTITAVGSRGSRASLNFSNILCVDQ